MINAIIIVIAAFIITYGLVNLFFRLTGINKRHDTTMERLNISFIHMMKENNKLMATLSVPVTSPSVVTYFVRCYPGILNKFRGNIKLQLFMHEYDIRESKIDNSRQFLIISKEQFFFMQLKGWIGTTDRNKAVKAIRYLKEMVSLP